MKHHRGAFEVICGSMFCGKTDELIRRLRRASIARQKVQVFKPAIDTRYAEHKVTSHAGSNYAAIPITQADEVWKRLDPDTTVVAIDEAQFFDHSIVDIAQKLADQGLRVIVAGLDTDFRGEPFGPMPELMAKAEVVDKLHAICMVCGESASRTQRLVNGAPAHYNDAGIRRRSRTYDARCRAISSSPEIDHAKIIAYS
jgi:thymidine kinase